MRKHRANQLSSTDAFASLYYGTSNSINNNSNNNNNNNNLTMSIDQRFILQAREQIQRDLNFNPSISNVNIINRGVSSSNLNTSSSTSAVSVPTNSTSYFYS